jgi:predicted Zn-dependent protease
MSAHDIQEPIALLREGKAGEAIPLLERLLQVSPGHVTCYVLLARAYAAEQRWSLS